MPAKKKAAGRKVERAMHKARRAGAEVARRNDDAGKARIPSARSGLL